MAKSRRKVLLFISLVFSILSYSVSSQAAFISPDDWNDLSTWTPSYNADTSITEVNYATSLSPASATLSTQGINSGIYMTSIEKNVTFIDKGSIQFELAFRTTDPDDKGTDYSQSVNDFLDFSFMTFDGQFFQMFAGNPSNFSPMVVCDIADLVGLSGTLYFDLYDQDNAKYTNAVISNLAFVPAENSPVPEPSTLALLFGGLAVFGAKAAARRKKDF